MICKRLYKSRNKCGYSTIYSISTKLFTCLDYFYLFFMYNTCGSDSFHSQGRYGVKWHFQHLPTGRTYGVFTDLSLNVKRSVL